ncbi:MAG: anaerobic carbon-monoxide dehydrogenase catalytic subunit [Planctomycetota bacterium]|nr:anaerobic carbon-monoxide dehydrogenase catalytic subunit [Planctomycetota bacterium]MDI6787392.1 anaerobic carbon-monoxide dehydrogenase catalytic subunit [Planctomycetota bacterium]
MSQIVKEGTNVMDDNRSVCEATIEMLRYAEAGNYDTAFQRALKVKPCPIGATGSCCKHCYMGPCRFNPKKPEESVGVCGADINTVAARNFARAVAAGTAAHSDHGREVAKTFIAAARKEVPGYEIKDEVKLKALARDFGVKTEGRSNEEIAEELGQKCLREFYKQDEELVLIKRGPEKRTQLWRELGVTPRGIDREVVELMHRTAMGVDQDYKNIMKQASRCSLSDGWGGSMIATELQDIMFGTPIPLRTQVNLGVLKKDEVNIIIHGHEPLLAEMIVRASRDPELINLAKQKGAKGINLAGMCCTGNEILLRQGVPMGGNFLQQEIAIITGAVEAMIVDVQCVMQSLPSLAKCFHTKIITTSSKAKIPSAEHIEFHEHDALNISKKIVRAAVENYHNRGKVHIPDNKTDLIAGFSHETINYMLGGSFRASYRPLNDNIINGRIRGVVGVVGCNNPRTPHDRSHLSLVRELIANDILVVETGCAAIACAKDGLLIPEAATAAGKGLREVCETVGIPPVLHCGSCVDNSRILVACSEMVREGGLGTDISDLPVAGCAPEWMSEKAIAIGQYFVSSGALVVFGVTWPTSGSEALTNHLFKEYENIFKGRWAFEPDAAKMASLIIDHINKKREALGIQKTKERVLYDMEARRTLEV